MKVIDFYPGNWRLVFNQLLREHPLVLPAVQDDIESSKIDRDYLYWSKAKHYVKEFKYLNLSEQELWAIIKYGRSNERINIPIIEGLNFTYSNRSIFQEKLFQIDQLMIEINQELDPSNLDLMNRYYVEGLVEEAIATSKFEGARTRREVAKIMLQSGRSPKDFHEYMIKNAYEVSKWVLEVKEKMGVPTILDVHNKLIQNTSAALKEDDFQFRKEGKEGVEIVGNYNQVIFRPTRDAQVIQNSMKNLVSFMNEEMPLRSFTHPIIKAILIHFWIAYIHPFYDGNGRTARMLFYWYLASQRKTYSVMKYIPISTLLAKSRKKYEEAYLYVEHDEHDLNYFVHYHLGLILESLAEFKAHIHETQHKLAQTQEQFKQYKLNSRQLSLLHHALRHPHGEYTVYSHSESHRVTRITATADLRGLVKKGLFTEEKKSKQLIFNLAKDAISISTP